MCVPPRLDERAGAFVLKLGGERVDVDAGRRELGEHLTAVAPVGRQERAGLAMVRQGRQRGLGQGVDRGRSGLRVLGARAGSASGTLPITATSQRLTKIDATEKTSGLSPAATRRSRVRLSSQRLWPISWSFCVAFMAFPPPWATMPSLCPDRRGAAP